MDVIICKTAEAAEKLTARMIADAINAKPEFKLGDSSYSPKGI